MMYMVAITPSEDYLKKLHSLGESAVAAFMMRFNYVWKELLDIHATGEKDYFDVQETILFSKATFRAFYSRSDDAIYLDIILD